MNEREDSVPLPFAGKWSDVIRITDPDLTPRERADYALYLDSFNKRAKLDGYTNAAVKIDENGELQFRIASWRDRSVDE